MILDIEKKGYTHFKNILNLEDVNELEQIIDDLHISYSQKINKTSTNADVLISILGLNSRLDHFVEKIIMNPIINKKLKDVMGNNFKIWTVNTRISKGRDIGLGMHSDSPGQANLWFFLNDQILPNGVTGVISGSHIFPRICNKLALSFIGVSKYLMEPLLGKAGDCSMFLNKTWHGRLPSNLNIENKILAIGIFCEGSKYIPMPEAKKLININSEYLQKKFGIKNSLSKIDQEYYKINSTGQIPYALEIEKNNFNIKILIRILFYLFIEIFVRPLKFLFLLKKKIFAFLK